MNPECSSFVGGEVVGEVVAWRQRTTVD